MKKITFNQKAHFQSISLILIVFLTQIISFAGFGQTQSQTFTSSGPFTVPFGVTSITVQCWGAGGGGSTITANGRRGGGGGGGAFASSELTVVPGTTYNIVVGTGGSANNAGGNSTFGATLVVAAGGSGGTNNSTTAGAGGTLAASTGTVEFVGGNGANGGGTFSGGGGGGAGTSGAGSNATNENGGAGAAVNGGNGANGVSGSNNGVEGSTYGGGGSGAVTNSGTDRTGGAGANGLVVVNWCPAAAISYAGTPFCNYIATPQPVTLSGTSGGTYSVTPAGLNLDAVTGEVTPLGSTPGTYTISYIIPDGGGCSEVNVQNTVTITPDVSTPVFTLGPTSSRFQAAGTFAFAATAANSTGLTFSLDAASLAAGNTISAATGDVTFTASWLGSSVITATATGCDGPKSSTHTVTTTLSAIYYSYQSGNWDQTSTWTFDPGGTTGPAASIPTNTDRVVILSGRTVTLSSDVSSTGLDITIEAGAVIDQGTYRFTNTLNALRGAGTLRLASANFPTVTNNTFVTADGGITEYTTSGTFNLPAAQTTYYHLTINNVTQIAQQINNLVLNGNLYVKNGTFQINDNSANRRSLTIRGNVTVDVGANITVGTGNTVTGVTTPITVTDGGTSPFINYYATETHTVIVQGDFINNGTVRFTNQTAPKYDAFPSNGAASVFFQGGTSNQLYCNGTTDFYNLILDKGNDQTFVLTLYSTAYTNFRLYGANIGRSNNSTTANPDVKKALWIRNGTLKLQGLTVIPSLSEGSSTSGSNTSNYIIPANGALLLDGSDVIVLSTADSYTEIQAAYGLTGGTNALYGIQTGAGSVSSLSVFGKLQVNNGYLSTRESAGIQYWSYASGEIIINGGEIDTKQLDDAVAANAGLITYRQTGGTITLRGRFQNTISYTTPESLTTPVVNTARASNSIDGNAGVGTFHLNTNLANGFLMSGGTINILDATGTNAASYAVFIGCPASNINVSGGTVLITPTNGTVTANTDYRINTKASFYNFNINRASGTSAVTLSANPLYVLNNLNVQSGDFNANLLNVSVGGNFTLASGTTYICTGASANKTIFNGLGSQNFEINLAAALNIHKLSIEKNASTVLNLTGTQATLNVADSLLIYNGTLNDNGHTVNAAGIIYNSGVHTGAGKIVMNSDAARSIEGDGTGEFGNLELNKPSSGSTTVALNAIALINGQLTFSGNATGYKLFNIKGNRLNFGVNASISGADANRYIHTNGLFGDGGVSKVYSASSPSFTFHMGAPSVSHAGVPNYSPATITVNGTATTYGSIHVVPVGSEHPNTTTKNRSLTYYWRVGSSGFTLGSATVTQGYTYSQNDVPAASGDISEAGFVAARYVEQGFTWTRGTANDVDETNNIAGEPGTGSFLENVAFIDGDYTAGDDNATNPFGVPRIFYSRINGAAAGSGLWSASSNWSYTSNTGTANTGGQIPGSTDIVIIAGNDSIYLGTNNTTANTDPRSCASLQIATGSALDIGYNPASSFGSVRTHSGGNGNFRLTTSWNSGSTYTFPSGDFSDFNINLGTTELYSTNPAAGTTYWIPNGITSYGNLILSPLGGSNIIFPNNELIIYGDLITRGQNADSWFCPTWDGNYPNAPTTRIAKTIYVYGDLDIQGGALVWYGNAAITQNFVVYGDVRVAPNAAIDVWSGATSQNLSIGGNLINNTIGTIAGGTTTNRACDFTTLPVTFFGNNPSSITNTLNTPLTVFERLTVNKGNSQATTLTINIGGTLNTPTNNWLFLQNGTLRYMRTNPGSDFTISTTNTFTIPSTSGLYIDYSNSGSRNILIANGASNTNDLLLYGKLTILNGNVYVGPTNGTTVNNNDIEYSSGGFSTIDVRGGNLIVNGQIRRNAATASGILIYNQQGGNVRINGQSQLATNAKLEVLNTGSSFNMSAGTLTIVRGGGTTFGDLYLRPQSGSITGGTIDFLPGTSGSQVYQVDANLPLNHITLSGSAGNTATLRLMVSPLELNGNLTISANSIFNTNSINTTFNGNFINSAGTAGYVAGTNTTTFYAKNSSSYLGAQSLTGQTSFYNLVINPGASLTVNNSLSVLNDLTISRGTMVLGSNLVQVSGNLVNNARYTDANLSSTGIELMGSIRQHISGNGNFGRLELDNAYGAQIDNSITMEENLVLTTGIFDINKYLLSLGLQSNILGAPFSASKMIITDGVFSDVGIRKFFPAGTSPTFLYPLGNADKYTPASLTITANNTVGYIRVNNINQMHPAVIDPANALNYFWEVESSGVTGLSGNMVFNYIQSDVVGFQENNYVSARLIVPGTSWSMTNTTDPGNNTITFTHTGSNNLGGEYTAGINTAFPPNVPIYTSNANGNWTDKNIWTQTGGSDYPCPDGGPNGFIVIVDHEVTANSNYCTAYRTTINNKLKIVSPYFGHNLGTVDGNGTLYLESGSIPAGVYTAFLDCVNDGTIEYGGSGNYNIIADLFTNIPNILVSGTGTRVLPNKDLTICKSLRINGPTLDNSFNNRKLTIQGTMELIAGNFISGTGANATVSFAGTTAQTVGGSLGNFTGSNAFNNFEINNNSGLTVNNSGSVEIKGNLLLTNGLINTNPDAPYNYGTFTITNSSINCVIPEGGSSSSFVNGPLVKKINQGDNFLFPIGIYKSGIGNIAGNKLKLSSSKTGTILWSAQYRNPNATFASFTSPLHGVSSKEYWTVKANAGSKAVININWDDDSDITPLVTTNGISDMCIADYNTSGSSWVHLTSTATGDDYAGTVSTTGFFTSTGNDDFTLGSLTDLRPKAKFDPLGPICGDAGIPVSFVHPFAIPLNYTLSYTIDGVAMTPENVTSVPYLLPSIIAGDYKLTGFTYNSGASTGVVDASTVPVNAVPTQAVAGDDQSLCGITSADLDANPGGILVGTGEWSIVSGNGGTLITPTSPTSQFIGLNGTNYTLRWTISNGTCVSTDDVNIYFTLLPAAPTASPAQTLCSGQVVSDIAVTPPLGSTVSWYLTSSGGAALPNDQLLVSGNYYAESNGGTGCQSLTRTLVVVTVVDQVWNGSVSTNWNTPGNWTCGIVPTLNISAHIPDVANKPVLSGGAIGSVKNISIASGSSLTISGNTLRIAGTITNSGTFDATAGTIEMRGSAAQSIGAGVFATNTINGLTINNALGVSLTAPLSVTGIVRAQSGDLSSDGNLTLASNATQTGLIDGTSTGQITGNVTMQRYLPSGYGYKYISSPFQAATVNELSDDLDLAASFAQVYKYDEDNHRDSSGVPIYTTGWVKYITGGDPLVPVTGYAANFGSSAAPKTIDITGVVNSNITTTYNLYNHNRLYTKGFNLIGNPYPSPIDWNSLAGWTKTNIDNAVYYFDAGITNQYTGTYSSYINGVSSNGAAGNIISSMQSFFIHVSNGSYPVNGVLGMDKRVRVNTLAPVYHKSARDFSIPAVRITATYGSFSTSDPAVVYFDDYSTNSFDNQFDALKLMNTDVTVPNLYLLAAESEKLSISAIPFPGIEDSIQKAYLGIKTENADWVILRATEIANIPSSLNVYLSDEAAGHIQNLKQKPEYRIQLSEGTSENRFALIFTEKELTTTNNDSELFHANITNGRLNVYVENPSGDNSTLSVCNVLGQVMLQKELNGNGLHIIDNSFASGVYILTLYTSQKVSSLKIYIPR